MGHFLVCNRTKINMQTCVYLQNPLLLKIIQHMSLLLTRITGLWTLICDHFLLVVESGLELMLLFCGGTFLMIIQHKGYMVCILTTKNHCLVVERTLKLFLEFSSNATISLQFPLGHLKKNKKQKPITIFGENPPWNGAFFTTTVW